MKKELLAIATVLTLSGCLQPNPACEPHFDYTADIGWLDHCIDIKIRDGIMFKKPIEKVRVEIGYCSQLGWLAWTEHASDGGCDDWFMLLQELEGDYWKAEAKRKTMELGEKKLVGYEEMIKPKKKKAPKAKKMGFDI